MEEIKLKSLRDSQKDKIAKTEDFMKKKAPSDMPPEVSALKKTKAPKKLARSIALLFFVFLVGGIGGVWMERIMIPTLLVRYPDLNRFDYLKSLNERTTIVHETEEVSISQEEAISDSIAKVSPSVVEVLGRDTAGQEVTIGSGIILTSDGYIITPLKNIFTGNIVNTEIRVKLKNGKIYTAAVSKQDTDYGLAMIKISENNLSVIPYADSENLKLGQKLIILSSAVTTDIVSRIVTDYVMTGSTDSSYQKRILISQDLGTAFSGSAVVNLEGKMVGVQQEADVVIPLSEIKSFIEQGTAR